MQAAARPFLALCLGFFSLGLLAWGCGRQDLYDLRADGSYTLMPERPGEELSFVAMKQQQQNFLPPEKIEAIDKIDRAWIRYELPTEKLRERPALMLGLCGSLDKVAFNDQVLADLAIRSNFSLDLSSRMQPYLLLPGMQDRNQLYFRVFKSVRTGLQPDCRELAIGSENLIVKRFAIFQAFEILTSIIMLFLALVSAIVWLLKRQATILLFSVFAAAIGGLFFAMAHPVHFSLTGFPWLFHIWNLSIMAIPAAFLAFFYHILPLRLPWLKLLALANLLPLVVGVVLIGGRFDSLLEDLRILVFRGIGLQIIIPASLCVRYLMRAPYPARMLAVGFSALFVGSIIDVVSFLVNGPMIESTCLALIIFMGCLLIYILQVDINVQRALEADRTRTLEEYSIKLEKEVQQRSAVLQQKTEELRRSNADLEERNILLSMSHKHLEDLITQKDALLKRVADIDRDIAPVLQQNLQQLNQQADRSALQALSIDIHKMASQLEPVVRLHSESEALKNRRIWLLEPEKRLLAMSKVALGGSRVELRSFMEADAFKQAFTEGQPNLAVISSEFMDTVRALHSSHPEVDIVMTARDDLNASIEHLVQIPKLCHVIYQDDNERALTQKNILVTVTKIIGNDIFGLEKYVQWGVDVKEYIITASRNRALCMDLIQSELSRSGILGSHVRNAMLITDELLMNAIYDAPVDRSTGRARYNHYSRRTAVDLEPAEYGKLRFAFDGTTIALSVEDPFGALQRETIIRYLKSCFDGQFGKLREHEAKGGGGMGLFQIMSTADLMITNVKKGERTEIIALIDVGSKQQARKRHGSFHYFLER